MGTGSLRILAATTGIAAGITITSLLWQAAYVEIAFSIGLGLLLLCVARLVPATDRPAMWKLVLVAFAVRAASGTFLRMASLEIGRDGFISGDDRQYFELASAFVSYLRGEPTHSVPPYWHGAAYLFGTWVYLQSVLLAVFGERPLIPVLANGAFGALTVLVCWDMARRMFGRRSGYLVVLMLAFHPSLTLWAATNLKDTLALFVIAVILWSLMRFLERPRLEPLMTVAAALVAMQSVRTYIFVGLSLILPVAVAASPHLAARRRALWTIAATTLSVTLLVTNQAGIGLAPALLTSSIQFREGMAAGARTGFQPARLEPGTTFVVPTPEPSPGATPPPSPSVIQVRPNARIVVIPAGEPIPTAGPGPENTYVRPGDVIVVGPEQLTEGELTRQTAAYLPIGLLYALFAPWPWLSERAIDLLTVPEMLLWYVALALLPFSLAITRERWRYFLGPLLFVGGTVLIFALVQGNWGTLFRHRAMVIPFVFILASPGLVALADLTRAAHATLASRRARESSTSAGELAG